MDEMRVFDGELIIKLKETISYGLEAIQWALPAIPVGAWIIVMGFCFGIAANVYVKVRKA